MCVVCCGVAAIGVVADGAVVTIGVEVVVVAAVDCLRKKQTDKHKLYYYCSCVYQSLSLCPFSCL